MEKPNNKEGRNRENAATAMPTKQKANASAPSNHTTNQPMNTYHDTSMGNKKTNGTVSQASNITANNAKSACDIKKASTANCNNQNATLHVSEQPTAPIPKVAVAPAPNNQSGKTAPYSTNATSQNIQHQHAALSQTQPIQHDVLRKGELIATNNAPMKLKTSKFKKNRIIVIAAVVLVAVAVAIYVIFFAGNAKDNGSGNQTIELSISDTMQGNDAKSAAAAISSYYSAIAEENIEELISSGHDETAAAISNKWLESLQYSVDASALGTAISNFPEAAGSYAGNDCYLISDFYPNCSSTAISSIITGQTGVQGWIYYDNEEMRWIIVDPTIPTATQAAEAGHVISSSSNGTVNVQMECSGAYSNPWWAYTMVAVNISSADTDNPVVIAAAGFDSGIETSVPDSLLAGIPKAAKENVDGTTAASITPGKASGICIIRRGVVSDFNIDKIGSDAMRIDGNVCPISISLGDEDITPVIAIGNVSSADIYKLLDEEQRKQYEVSAENTDNAAQNAATLKQEAESHGYR